MTIFLVKMKHRHGYDKFVVLKFTNFMIYMIINLKKNLAFLILYRLKQGAEL